MSEPDGGAHTPRSSNNPNRRVLMLVLTAWEYETVTARALMANLSRPQYIREAMLVFPLLRSTSPTELLPHTARAIVCVRALAQMTAASMDVVTRRRLEAATAELYRTTDELERHTARIAAALALLPPP